MEVRVLSSAHLETFKIDFNKLFISSWLYVPFVPNLSEGSATLRCCEPFPRAPDLFRHPTFSSRFPFLPIPAFLFQFPTLISCVQTPLFQQFLPLFQLLFSNRRFVMKFQLSCVLTN